jgi:hypothetical protein
VWSRAVLAVLHLLWFAASCGSLLLAATVPSNPMTLMVGRWYVASISDTQHLALILAGLSSVLAGLWLLVGVLVRPLAVRLGLLSLLWLGWPPLLGVLSQFGPAGALGVTVWVGEPGEEWWQMEHVYMCP